MNKYKVYLKGGTVLEVEACAVATTTAIVHFYEKKEEGEKPCGSFLANEIYGYCKSDRVKLANENVGPAHGG